MDLRFIWVEPEGWNHISKCEAGYAARSSRMMYPGSSAAEQREHFWPGLTLAVLPEATTIPSTVCVQMGQ
jgi:hypothetical protein